MSLQSQKFNCNKCGNNASRSQSTSSPITGFSQPPCHPASDVEPGGGPEPSNPSPRLAQYVRTCSEPKSEFGSTSTRNIDTIDPTDNIPNSDYSGNHKPQSSVSVVFNYSGIELDDAMDKLLNRGLNYCVLPKKSRIRETLNLSTDADRRTDTILKRLRDLSKKKIKI